MKNFPDQDQFNELGKRLQGYSEEPDELVWQNIDKALRPRKTPVWIPWIDGTTAITSIVLLALLWSTHNGRESDLVNETQVVTSLKKESDVRRSQIREQEKTPPGAAAVDRNAEGTQQNEILHNRENKTYTPYTKASHGLSKDEKQGDNGHELIVVPIASIVDTDASSLENSDSPGDDGNKNEADSLQIAQSKEIDSTYQKESVPKSEKRIPKRGLSFYVGLTPQLSFQRVIPVSNDGVVISDFYNQSIISADRLGFGIDAGIQGHLSKRWEYFGGLSFYQQNQTLKYAYQSDKVSLEPSKDSGYIVTPKNEVATVRYAMRNWGANVGLMYNLQGKKLAHKVGGGLSYQKGLNKQISESYNNSESSYLFYNVFYRNELRLSAKLRVYVQPTFTHSLYTKEKLDAPFHLRPYRAGIGFGILYDF